MRAYSIVNGVIDNIIEVKSINQFRNMNLIDATGQQWSIGDKYKDGVFSKKPEVRYVPQIVSKFQGKAALLQAGLLPTVTAIMDDPGTPELIKMAWADTNEFVRASPAIATIIASLGLTDEQIDDLFIAASKIII